MFSVAIEGNIGAGKSFFLEYLSEKFPNRINIFKEPVHKWRDVNNVNLFDLMYKDPKRYGFIFQSYVQLTMLQMHDEISQIQVKQKNSQQQSNSTKITKDHSLILRDLTNKDEKIDQKKRKTSPNDECIANLKKVLKTSEDAEEESKLEILNELIANNDDSKPNYLINMMERSIFSARYIFVENLFQNKLLTEIEYSILDDTFLYLIKKQDIKLDLIVYLRSKPEECYRRMVERSRPEETQTLQLEHCKYILIN